MIYFTIIASTTGYTIDLSYSMCYSYATDEQTMYGTYFNTMTVHKYF